MKRGKLAFIVVMFSMHSNYAMNSTDALQAMGVSKVVKLNAVALPYDLTELALSKTPAIIDFGIYHLVNRFKKPAIIIFGTEATILLVLSCYQEDPLACLSSFININSLQHVAQISLNHLSIGSGYALGEEMSRRALLLAQGDPAREIIHTVMTVLAATGVGFYSWSLDSSLPQSIALSICSAIMLNGLTFATHQPFFKAIRQKATHIFDISSINPGKVIGVATIAGGVASLAYSISSSEVLSRNLIDAVSSMKNPQALRSVWDMVQSNMMWITGYRWTKEKFKKQIH